MPQVTPLMMAIMVCILTQYHVAPILKTTMLDDPESLVPPHERDEDPPPLESWSPPPPSSIPICPQTRPTCQQPTSNAGDVPSISLAGLQKTLHPSPSLTLPGGQNLLQVIDRSNQFAGVRVIETDEHYPFASRTKWQLAKWLGSAPLPQSEVDKFL
jgi:hypothetical protein